MAYLYDNVLIWHLCYYNTAKMAHHSEIFAIAIMLKYPTGWQSVPVKYWTT